MSSRHGIVTCAQIVAKVQGIINPANRACVFSAKKQLWMWMVEILSSKKNRYPLSHQPMVFLHIPPRFFLGCRMDPPGLAGSFGAFRALLPRVGSRGSPLCGWGGGPGGAENRWRISRWPFCRSQASFFFWSGKCFILMTSWFLFEIYFSHFFFCWGHCV